jgi:hypothetical protein
MKVIESAEKSAAPARCSRAAHARADSNEPENGSNEPWAAHVVRNRKWSRWTTRQMDHQAVQVHLACYDEAA